MKKKQDRPLLHTEERGTRRSQPISSLRGSLATLVCKKLSLELRLELDHNIGFGLETSDYYFN